MHSAQATGSPACSARSSYKSSFVIRAEVSCHQLSSFVQLALDSWLDRITNSEEASTTDSNSMPAPLFYFRGMKRDECVAPIPGRPCLTGLYEMENSPR